MLTIKNKHTRILIFIVCAVLGFMITMQLKSQQRYQTVSVQRAEELSVRLKEVQADRDKLDKELSEYRAGRVSDTVQKEMEALRSRAGETALEGKGVILTIDDSNQAIKAGENKNLYIIHDEDLLRVINELRAAGAEAIALNGCLPAKSVVWGPRSWSTRPGWQRPLLFRRSAIRKPWKAL